MAESFYLWLEKDYSAIYFMEKTTLSVVFLLICSLCLNGQELLFHKLSIDDGLSQNTVLAILQDSKGFVWMGTKDGLNRYDGKYFLKYYPGFSDENSLSDNHITELFEDSREWIWIGTHSGVLNLYKVREDRFYHFNLPEVAKGIGLVPEITSIIEDENNDIWVGTSGMGLFYIQIEKENPDQSIVSNFVSTPMAADSLFPLDVKDLYLDDSHNLWIASVEGLVFLEKRTGAFKKFVIDNKNPLSPVDPFDRAIGSIHSDGKGKLWLGTLSGLVLFDLKTNTFQSFPHRFEIDRYGWGIINSILPQTESKLWLATVAGLMKFDTETLKYEYFFHSPGNPGFPSYNTISSLMLDRSGLIWVGTAGMGVNYFDPSGNRFPVLRKSSANRSREIGFSIRSILELNDSLVWISSDVLNLWNRNTEELISFEDQQADIEKFGNLGPWSMDKSSGEITWFASSEGLYSYNIKTEEANYYSFNEDYDTVGRGLPQQYVYEVKVDSEGSVWILTENYLSKLLDAEKAIFKKVLRYKKEIPTNEWVRPVLAIHESEFWIGYKGGLVWYDPDSGEEKRYRKKLQNPKSMSNNDVKCILPDPRQADRFIWIGTSGGGLNRLDKTDGTFTVFNHYHGLPNNVIYGVLDGNDGELWLSTNNGLCRFNPETQVVQNYDSNDGLQSNEFNTGAYFKAATGELFFGGIKGLNYFFPDKIFTSDYKAEVVISSLELGSQLVSPLNYPELTNTTAAYTNSLVLNYNHHPLTINFAALDFGAPEKIRYKYKLEGLNQDWIELGNQSRVSLYRIPTGEYHLQIRGTNKDGVWSENEASLMIRVSPPWWNTGLAFVLYALILILGIIVLRKYEMGRIRLRNKHKMEKIQLETLQELDTIKTNFFSNISHELKTPLSLILGHLELLKGDSPSSKNKNKIEAVESNANRLLVLVNQLLDLSRLEAKKMQPKYSKIELVSFIRNLVFSFESYVFIRNIGLDFNAEPDSIPVILDREAVEKMINNLLSNAVKFTPPGGKILVNIKCLDSNKVSIKVADTGKGMTEEQLEKIFDRYYQIEELPGSNLGGSGIGLALVSELVKMQQGTISVTSEPAKGTCFELVLPAAPEGDFKLWDSNTEVDGINPVFFHSKLRTTTETTEAVSGNPLLLVVEDNSDLRKMINDQLSDIFEVLDAENGRVGLLKAIESIPDLIISDLMMPEMDGLQMLKKLRSDEKTSHIPVVFLSARAELEDRLKGFEYGVDAYLPKPFSLQELKHRAVNLIRQREMLKFKYSSSHPGLNATFPGSEMEKGFLNKIADIIRNNLQNEQFSVEQLAEFMNMSSSQLTRKLNALINQSPNKLILTYRFQLAVQLLKTTQNSISEIAFQTGFKSPSYFSSQFKKEFGCSPREYRS